MVSGGDHLHFPANLRVSRKGCNRSVGGEGRRSVGTPAPSRIPRQPSCLPIPPVHPAAYCTPFDHTRFRIENNRGVAVYFCVLFCTHLRDQERHPPRGSSREGVRGRSRLNCSRNRPSAPKPGFCWMCSPGGRKLLARNLVLLPTTTMSGVLC